MIFFKSLLLLLIQLFIPILAWGQTIICFDKEQSSFQIKSFDVFLASNDSFSIEKKVNPYELNRYIDSIVCVRSFGYSDHCFRLQSGQNLIGLVLKPNNIKEIEIIPNQYYRSAFIDAINKYTKNQEKRNKKDYLIYYLSATLCHQHSCYMERMTCLVRVKTNSFKKKKTLHSFEYIDLTFLEKPDSSFDERILDSLSIMTTIYCNLNESFWNYKKDWDLVRQNISKNKDNVTKIDSDSDSLRSFCLSREGFIKSLNQYKKAKFIYHFENDFTLTKTEGVSYGLINAYNRLVLGAKRFDIEYTIEYSENSAHYPSYLSLTNNLTQTNEYLLWIELTLLDSTNTTAGFNKTNILPINWPHSTKAWLKSQSIPINTIE